MFDWLSRVLSTGPSTRWYAEVTEPAFVTSAQITEGQPASEDSDYQYELGLNFKEPVRDGNDISHINIRDQSGNIVLQLELYTGESTTSFFVKEELPDRELSAVTVNQDGTARDTAIIKIYEEPIS